MLWLGAGVSVAGLFKHRHKDAFMDAPDVEARYHGAGPAPDAWKAAACVAVWPGCFVLLLGEEVLGVK
jgi:hypothetical protein